MSHLVPFLAIGVVLVLATDRGSAAVRVAARMSVGAVRGLGEYLRALGQWYARVAFGSSGR